MAYHKSTGARSGGFYYYYTGCAVRTAQYHRTNLMGIILVFFKDYPDGEQRNYTRIRCRAFDVRWRSIRTSKNRRNEGREPPRGLTDMSKLRSRDVVVVLLLRINLHSTRVASCLTMLLGSNKVRRGNVREVCRGFAVSGVSVAWVPRG